MSRTFTYHLGLPLARLLSIQTLTGWSGVKLVTPFYHTVSAGYLPHVSPLYPVMHPDALKADLAAMARYYRFVSAGELHQHIRAGSSGKERLAFLSFDDGLLGCYEVVRAVLKDLDIPATFFVNPGFIDSGRIFYRYKVALVLDRLNSGRLSLKDRQEMTELLREHGRFQHGLQLSLEKLEFHHDSLIDELLELLDIRAHNASVYMSRQQIRELAEEGFDIGGHSMDHPHFGKLSLDEQLRQVGESVDFCQREFGSGLRLFAFPFYDYDLKTALFKQMRNELRIDLSFGTSGLKTDVFKHHIQRLPMEERICGNVTSFIKHQLLLSLFRRAVGRQSMKRQ